MRTFIAAVILLASSSLSCATTSAVFKGNAHVALPFVAVRAYPGDVPVLVAAGAVRSGAVYAGGNGTDTLASVRGSVARTATCAGATHYVIVRVPPEVHGLCRLCVHFRDVGYALRRRRRHVYRPRKCNCRASACTATHTRCKEVQVATVARRRSPQVGDVYVYDARMYSKVHPPGTQFGYYNVEVMSLERGGDWRPLSQGDTLCVIAHDVHKDFMDFCPVLLYAGTQCAYIAAGHLDTEYLFRIT